MILLSQRDPRWSSHKLGNSDLSMRDFGCLITSLAMLIGTTPDVVNSRMRDVGGFDGALVIWSKIPHAFPGIQINRVFAYNNTDVKKNIPNVIVEVPAKAIGGSDKHWVVFIGNRKCHDPFLGVERPTNDFVKHGDPSGYCVISGRWNDLSISMGDDQKVNLIREIVNTAGVPSEQVRKIKEIITR